MASVPCWLISEVSPVKPFLLSIILKNSLNNRFLSRAFQACFSACESLPATSFLQGVKIQHFFADLQEKR